MGSALIEGWTRSGLRGIVSTRSAGANREAAAGADFIVVTVKPHLVLSVAGEIRDVLRPGQVLISGAAAVPLAALEERVDIPVFRAISNLPAAIGKAATAVATHASDAAPVVSLFARVGAVELVPEAALHAVTGLSGSGPAYAYLVIEALAAGGVKQGLKRDAALRLAAQTLAGAAAMVLETGVHPAELRDRVVTPGGTTIAGLHELEKAGVRAAFMAAVEAGTRRSEARAKELA
jgi:pyrroline-5-carboxylate reductase